MAWIGDANNMAYTWLQAAELSGFTLHVATPPGYPLDPSARACTAAAHCEVFADPLEAAQRRRPGDHRRLDQHGLRGRERGAPARLSRTGGSTREMMAAARPDAVFMHCLPAHRGEEVAADVLDGPQSVVWDEAENRLHVQKALMEYLLLAKSVS